jgi:hypothetical protein
LAYRLKNHAAVRRCAFDVPEFAGATRQVARTFGACFPDDPQLQASIVAALRPQDEAARGTRWTRLDSLVVEALLVACHTPATTTVRVGRIAETVNGILAGRGDTIQVSSRKVGGILRSLNFFSDRERDGYGFVLFDEVRRKIHQHGRALEVPTMRESVADCAFCAEAIPEIR